jgi:hypothetical protein
MAWHLPLMPQQRQSTDRNEILRNCDKPNLLPRLFESIGMLDKGARHSRTVRLKKRYFWLAMNLIEVESVLRRGMTLPTRSIPGERP